MLSFFSAASIAASPAHVPDPRLRELLTEVVAHWKAVGVLDLTHLLVVQPGDSEENIREEVGFSPLVDLEGHRFGSPGFTPQWDELRDHGGWFELTVCVGDSGFAYVLFIADRPGELLTLCRTYAA
jgi:hypothetical protein